MPGITANIELIIFLVMRFVIAVGSKAPNTYFSCALNDVRCVGDFRGFCEINNFVMPLVHHFPSRCPE